MEHGELANSHLRELTRRSVSRDAIGDMAKGGSHLTAYEGG